MNRSDKELIALLAIYYGGYKVVQSMSPEERKALIEVVGDSR